MAGSITVSSITLDSDNNFSIRSNTGATILSANGTGLITGIANGASIVSAQLTTPTVSGNLSLDSTGTTGVRSPAANTLAFHTSGAEDMRITSAGNVGIGTSSPAGTLEVNSVGNPKSITSYSTTNFAALGSGTAGSGVFYGTGTYLTFNNQPFADRGTDNNLTERMRIDSSGRVTMPYQPAFYAMMNNTNISSTAAIVFNNVFVNIGSHYNSSNGRFTAPIAGTYHFSANCLKRNGVGRLLFHKNDAYYGAGVSQVFQGTTSEIPMAATIIITLAAGDYINVIASVDAGDVYGSPNSHNGFSGFLIG